MPLIVNILYVGENNFTKDFFMEQNIICNKGSAFISTNLYKWSSNATGAAQQDYQTQFPGFI